jgi:hypothetical protein
MKRDRWLPPVMLAVALAGVVAATGAGCDRDVREAKAPAKPNAATVPADVATQPVTQPADAVLAADPEPAATPETKPVAPPQPVLAFLLLDGLGAQFPPTKLLVHGEEDGKLRVELFSDLPKSALKDYDGNELYFEMNLAEAGPQQVEGGSWRFKSTSSDRSDSANGLFLNGQRRHLQPDDVLVKFDRRGDQLLAQIMGQFRAYEPGTPDALAPFVGVRGELTVDVVEKR